MFIKKHTFLSIIVLINTFFFGLVYYITKQSTEIEPIPIVVGDSIYSESASSSSKKSISASSQNPSSSPQGLKISLPILMYHSISDFSTISPKDPNVLLAQGLKIPPSVLKEQLSFIKSKSYNTITLAQLVDYISKGTPLPPKPIILTFDDGWADNYAAFKILQENEMVGDFAIITNLLDKSDRLSKSQVKEMSEAGMGISSHTSNHFNLAQLTPKQLDSELKDSKLLLENLISKPVESIIYPTGAYNESVIKTSKNKGYKIGLTTRPYKDNIDTKIPFELTRVRVQCNTGQIIRDNRCPNKGGAFFTN
jgi:peptidoglycan/xylan/chitin deacetylase (PgdA/CDA1 family)